MSKKTLLMILDGWGIPEDQNASAIHHAATPYIDSLYQDYPNATLLTHGMNVGLPDGQMGNSEVGHMKVGAGRIVYQDLAKIDLAVQNKTLSNEKTLVETFEYAKENNKDVHFLGLVSDGGVHSHINHLKALVSAANNSGVTNSYIHAFTDGRDVDPKSGINHLKDLQQFLVNTNTKLASVIGRYYAMDRDQRWERVKKAYDLLVHNSAETITSDPIAAIENSYKENVTDEFIAPILCTENDKPIARIKNGDVVIFFNFRTDRGRQLTRALTQENFPEFNMEMLDLYYCTMTNYDATFSGVHVIFDKENIEQTLGAVLEQNNKTQIRIAETEKYPHVTFFFNGGREKPFKGEERILCASPKVATYDLQPEMSCYDIKDAILPEIQKEAADFICLNFANPDMVGHTGSMDAAIKACEAVDRCTKEIVTLAKEKDYTIIIIADHGNCEKMVNEDGTPNTAHTINPVPIILIDEDIKTVNQGILGDIAPTVLKLLNVAIPSEMTGKVLF